MHSSFLAFLCDLLFASSLQLPPNHSFYSNFFKQERSFDGQIITILILNLNLIYIKNNPDKILLM